MRNAIKAILLSLLINGFAMTLVLGPAPRPRIVRAVDKFFSPGESMLVAIFCGILDIQPFGLIFDLFVNTVLVSAVSGPV